MQNILSTAERMTNGHHAIASVPGTFSEADAVAPVFSSTHAPLPTLDSIQLLVVATVRKSANINWPSKNHL